MVNVIVDGTLNYRKKSLVWNSLAGYPTYIMVYQMAVVIK